MSKVLSLPVVNLTAYQLPNSSPKARQEVADSLVQACHEFGFVAIVGYGLPDKAVKDAFEWSQRLFALPTDEKMKAPHPAAAMPHRGYSAPGLEKVYSREDARLVSTGDSNGGALRAITDYKESFEIGSDENDDQPNIWLPEDVLPGFRTAMSRLYWSLDKIADSILSAMADGLHLKTQAERNRVMTVNGHHANQLRLLHYPPVEEERLRQRLVARMPAHTDWGSFTLLFQDTIAGLQFQDPRSKQWIFAEPTKDAVILNIGDFFERLTNGYLKSAVHRVSLPKNETANGVLPERYSIPYFIGPLPTMNGECLETFCTDDYPAKYEALTYAEYATWRAKYSY